MRPIKSKSVVALLILLAGKVLLALTRSTRLSSPQKPDDAFAAVLLISRGATIKNVHHIPRLLRNSPLPVTEPAVLIDGFHPLIQKRALGFVLIGFLALSFENQKVTGL